MFVINRMVHIVFDLGFVFSEVTKSRNRNRETLSDGRETPFVSPWPPLNKEYNIWLVGGFNPSEKY